MLAVLLGLIGQVKLRGAAVPLSLGRRVVAPLVLGAISASLTLWIWSGNGFAPQYHDESSYLLQAGIFANGRWSDPSPPLAEFFEQFHVLVEPTRASKYPPGHAVLLTLGVAVGAPPSVPLLLVAGTAALLFVLTRRLAGERAAFLAWLVWTTAPGLFRFRSSYFSEATTSFLWLAVWWAVLRWKDTGRPYWLAAAAFASSWGAITRPLTMLLFVAPLAVAISRRLIRRRNPRELLLSAIAGALPLLLLPLWSYRTVGSWSSSPLGVYTRAYLPFDRLGFGLDGRPPERSLPECMTGLARRFRPIHRDHRPAALPVILGQRVTTVLRDAFDGPRSLLFVFALLGVARLPRDGILAAITALCLLLGYLLYAHPPEWSIYYLETQSVLAGLSGIGLAMGLRSLPNVIARPIGSLLVVAITTMFVFDAMKAREQVKSSSPRLAAFHSALASVPVERPAVVFVRCKPGVSAHESLVQNGPDLEHARLWLVHDLGEANSRLRDRAPGRRAYLYDEARGLLQEIDQPKAQLVR